jgi:hypothetical protein
MKSFLLLLFTGLLMFACNSASKNNTVTVAEEPAADNGFFPVTSYLRGQIAQLKTNGPNPVRILKQGDKVDSLWLKMEQLDSIFAVFLHPVIDTVNMQPFFKETKFEDKTINTFTFTYEPKAQLPDSVTWRRWDIYVDPETGSVKRIFLEKEMPDNKSLQLSWKEKSDASITLLKQDKNGNWVLEKEEKFIWNFDEEL